MRIIRNIGHVKQRRRIARISAMLGFVMLASTFALIFVPRFVIAAYALLIVGFILFNYGMQQLGKWSHGPRHARDDLALDSQLQTFADRYALLHYVPVGREVIEHLLVHPGGVLVVTTRDLPGIVVGRGNKWRKRSSGFLRFFSFSGPQLGNPTADTDRGVAAVEAALATAALQFEVDGAIVFTSPAVELDVIEPDYPVMQVQAFDDFVKSLPVDSTLRNAERDALVELLGTGDELERTEPARSRRRPVRVKRRAA